MGVVRVPLLVFGCLERERERERERDRARDGRRYLCNNKEHISTMVRIGCPVGSNHMVLVRRSSLLAQTSFICNSRDSTEVRHCHFGTTVSNAQPSGHELPGNLLYDTQPPPASQNSPLANLPCMRDICRRMTSGGPGSATSMRVACDIGEYGMV
jgi:hypothetical protein